MTERRRRDVSQPAKMVVGIARGEIEDSTPEEGKKTAAVALGRKAA